MSRKGPKLTIYFQFALCSYSPRCTLHSSLWDHLREETVHSTEKQLNFLSEFKSNYHLLLILLSDSSCGSLAHFPVAVSGGEKKLLPCST